MNAITLSLYVGYAIFSAFPYKTMIVSTGSTLFMRVFIAVLLYAVSCGISYYVIRRHLRTSGPREFVKKAILVILDICFLLALAYLSFGIQHVVVIPAVVAPTLSSLFDSTNYFFWWFIAPLVALFFI